MPKRLRLTRRPNLALSEDGFRKLRAISAEAGLNEGEFLSFLFENWGSVIDEEKLTAGLRLFNSELDERKR